MRKAPIAIFTAFVLSSGQQAIAQERIIEPAGDWVISSDDESCTLVRSFSAQTPGDTQLYIKSWGPNAPSRFSIVGPTVLRDKGKALMATVGFGENEETEIYAIASAYRDQPMIQFQAARPRPRADYGSHSLGYIYSRTFRDLAVGYGPSSQSLHIDAPDMAAQNFHIGQMAAPIAMLEQCEEGLVKKWGYDPAFEKKAVRPPILENAGSVARNLQLPTAYIVNHRSWIAQIRLTVSPEGEVRDCILQAPEFSRKSTRELCQSIDQFARFSAALDADGEPASALYHASIMYVRAD